MHLIDNMVESDDKITTKRQERDNERKKDRETIRSREVAAFIGKKCLVNLFFP